ncbi:MerR family transcriptional regulator [Nocardioides sp. ChNu-153]|uniref:MerR family transcriptional regulator n=1 Tax=unclassified Nocardioides TaxID=2615069 RepID=UPI002404F5F1|nr:MULTISPECIES: MerR family transcriptional regulator [unclassified Nocardioides]MDF9714787.1 MerR family transcriptional regulator [Nocardioides sp. ChNu-99]MDN7120087.1 MerR family transcriptional regulator [Nocardioides sp. ChNu-153]
MTAIPERPEHHDPDGATLTIDELSARAGTTVRTTRYYASLGLIPPPERRGRVAYYGDVHLARLEMVRALQDHGFTLQAIERYLASVSSEATTEELALQRAMLTSWTTEPPERLTRRQLEKRAGRRLEDEEVEVLVQVRAVEVEPGTDRYVVLAGFALGLEMLSLDIPITSVIEATETIERHMESLADELTEILRTQVVRPFRAEQHTPEEAARMERTVSALRRITLEGVVVGFQRAANQVIERSLRRR